jgi:hypothetical protein
VLGQCPWLLRSEKDYLHFPSKKCIKLLRAFKLFYEKNEIKSLTVLTILRILATISVYLS